MKPTSFHLKTLPGVFDIIPKEGQEVWRSSPVWQHVEKVARECAKTFGFKEIRTPLIEREELFTSHVGDSSDIVTKEMYTFLDKGKRAITLRPEGTVPTLRAIIENNLELPQKLFYIGPQFRYERQQRGRYRQHHQFGVEAVGIKSAFQEAEVISLLFQFYQGIGLKNLTVHLNSLGGEETRQEFRSNLKYFFDKHREALSLESQNRLSVNPLRILDSKDEGDKEIIKEAPSMTTYLRSEERERIGRVSKALERLKIPFEYDERLVRGLDYYNETVFEVLSHSSNKSLGGGGRYDGLMRRLGGQDVGAVGAGIGLERVIQTLILEGGVLPKEERATYHLILNEEVSVEGLAIGKRLRELGIVTEISFQEGKKSFRKTIEKVNAQFFCILSKEMLGEGVLKFKEKGDEEKLFQLNLKNLN
jgi:histidyl-tRNA synthetase